VLFKPEAVGIGRKALLNPFAVRAFGGRIGRSFNTGKRIKVRGGGVADKRHDGVPKVKNESVAKIGRLQQNAPPQKSFHSQTSGYPFRCRTALNFRTLFYTDTALFDRNAFNHRNRDGRTYFGVPRDRGRQGKPFISFFSSFI
jgi:hypothetical protein